MDFLGNVTGPQAKRKRCVGTGVAPRAKLQKFAPPALGANGRPIVLANVKYSVDLAAQGIRRNR